MKRRHSRPIDFHVLCESDVSDADGPRDERTVLQLLDAGNEGTRSGATKVPLRILNFGGDVVGFRFRKQLKQTCRPSRVVEASTGNSDEGAVVQRVHQGSCQPTGSEIVRKCNLYRVDGREVSDGLRERRCVSDLRQGNSQAVEITDSDADFIRAVRNEARDDSMLSVSTSRLSALEV